MIRNIFFPEKIKGYYLFSKRVVGLDITKNQVSATQLYIKGTSVTIEKYVEEKIENGNGTHERIVKALKTVIAKLDKFDELHTALSSSLAVVKELRLPFLSAEKIKMVVRYEIEPLLPFAAQDAAIDFIITKQYEAEGSSDVLVAAIQNQHIAAHLQLLAEAGVSPTIITLDIFSLYGFFKRIPKYAQVKEGIALVDLGMQATRIAYIHEGRLKFIRTIAKGLVQQVKTIAESLQLQPNEAMEQILRFGLEKTSSPTFAQITHDTFASFWQEIQFTLQSFIATAPQELSLAKILLLGPGAEIKGMVHFASQRLASTCELILPTDILHDPSIAVKEAVALPSSSIISLSTALPSPITEEFNLRQGEFAPPVDKQLNQQIIIAASLLVLVLGAFTLNNYFQLKKLRTSAKASEQEALTALKERAHFTKALDEGLKGTKEQDRLEEAITIAENEVEKQREMWFAFAGPTRASVLKYLLELTNKIDKETLGFVIESLAIGDGVMTIKAQVKNHEALRVLERELKQSKLFSYVPSQEETSFTMKILLSKNGEGA